MVATLIQSILAAAVLAFVVWAAAWRPWRRDAQGVAGAGAIAVAIGFFAGYWITAGLPPWPPKTAAQFTAYLVLVVGAVAVFELWWSRRVWSCWPVRVVLGALAFWAILWPMAEHTWSTGETVLWGAGLLAALWIWWALVEMLAVRRPGASMPLVAWAACATLSVGLILGNSALLGQLSAVMAGIFGAAVVLALFAPNFGLQRGAVTVWSLLHAALLWQGLFYAELPTLAAALLFFAPLAAWGGELDWVRRRPAWAGVLIHAVLVTLPAAVGLGIAYQAWAAEPAGPYY